jgi:hypothetical protein
MSIRAIVLDVNQEPISDEITVLGDNFDAAEQAAKTAAQSGTKCCIRWRRDSDGQGAFWGPHGASLDPHWYA